MKQSGVLILSIMFLFLGHGQAFSYPQGLGIDSGNAISNTKEYKDYTQSVRLKIGDTFSKSLDVLEAGTVNLDFEIASDGRLVRVSVDIDKTKASAKMVEKAIKAVRKSSPFDPFPPVLAKNSNKLPFYINLNLKPVK